MTGGRDWVFAHPRAEDRSNSRAAIDVAPIRSCVRGKSEFIERFLG